MKRRTPLFVRALLLLIVAIGPLQAQAIFACAMMDMAIQDECCCEHAEAARDCESPDCGDAPVSSDAPCCEYSVDIILDPDSGQDGSIFKPVDLRSDVDPPHLLFSSIEARFTPQAISATRRSHFPSSSGDGGSDTYLVTLRLRI